MSSGAPDLPINWTITEFLERFRMSMSMGRFSQENSDKRRQELAELGLEFHHVREEVLKLQPEQQFRGPEPDDNYPDTGIVHLFQYRMKPNINVYVKIGIRMPQSRNSLPIAVIYSFKPWKPQRDR